MDSLSRAEIVRRYFAAWETGNRRTLKALLASDFTFSSPRDDRISRAAYWDTCWANHNAIRGFRLVTLLDTADEAFVLYECELTSEERFRNAEYFRFAGNQIQAVAEGAVQYQAPEALSGRGAADHAHTACAAEPRRVRCPAG